MRSAFFVVMTTLAALNSVQGIALNTSEGDATADPAKKEEAKGAAPEVVDLVDTFFKRENPAKISDQELAAAFDKVD